MAEPKISDQGDAESPTATSQKDVVLTFLDYTAAFDSVSHKFIDEALEQAKCSDKTIAIFRQIYDKATAVVRVALPGDSETATSSSLPVDRGVVQGDIFSPVCFIIALECLLRSADEPGGVNVLGVLISKLEYADDACLCDESIEQASHRISAVAKGSREKADMEISVPKTEFMIVRDDACDHAVTEEEYAAVKWNHECEFCGRGFDSRAGKNVHIGRWCKVATSLYGCRYEIDSVVDVRGQPEQRFYRVRWKGWAEKHDTWQNWRDFQDGGMEAVDAFWEKCERFQRDKPAWVEGEIRCKQCTREFVDLKRHRNCRWAVASRKGTRAERKVIRKRKAQAQLLRGTVLIEGQPLKNAFQFRYLGSEFCADGDALVPVEARMEKAAVRFSMLCQIWKSSELSVALKLRLYAAAVVSVLIYGCEAWQMTEGLCKKLGAWNARRLAFVTGREIRDEYCVPSFDLVARVRARRLRWAGHLLRASEEYLPRRVAVAQLESDLQWGALFGTTSIFQDAPDGFELEELVELAEDRVCWRAMVKAIEPEDALWEQRQLRSRKKDREGECEEMSR